MEFFIFLGIAAIPAIAAIVLRVNAVLYFASIAAGELLVLHFGDDAEIVLGMVVRGSSADVAARLIVLFLPIILTFIFNRKTVTSSKLILHAIPIIATSLLISVFAYPLLPSGFRNAVNSSPFGSRIINSIDIIIGVAVVLDLLLLWFTHRTKGSDHKSSKR